MACLVLILGGLRFHSSGGSLLALRRLVLRGLGRAGVGLLVEAGGDDGHAHLVAQVVVDDGAEDDVGVLVRLLFHDGCGVVDLHQAQVGTASHRNEHALRALHGGLQQRGVDGLLGCRHHPVLAAGGADAHERGTSVRHDGAHVGEVHVDHARDGDEVGDALDTVVEHLIRGAEGLHHGKLGFTELQQAVVRDDDDGVADFLEVLNALQRLAGAALALKGERAGHHTDGQRAHFLGDASHDRSRAGARAAALAGGDEHHVGPLQGFLDFLLVVFGRSPPNLGVRTRTEAAGGLASDVELGVGIGKQQRLGVGVDCNKLDALQAFLDHAVDGVDAAAADSDDADHGEVVGGRGHGGGLAFHKLVLTVAVHLVRKRARICFLGRRVTTLNLYFRVVTCAFSAR